MILKYYFSTEFFELTQLKLLPYFWTLQIAFLTFRNSPFLSYLTYPLKERHEPDPKR